MESIGAGWGESDRDELAPIRSPRNGAERSVSHIYEWDRNGSGRIRWPGPYRVAKTGLDLRSHRRIFRGRPGWGWVGGNFCVILRGTSLREGFAKTSDDAVRGGDREEFRSGLPEGSPKRYHGGSRRGIHRAFRGGRRRGFRKEDSSRDARWILRRSSREVSPGNLRGILGGFHYGFRDGAAWQDFAKDSALDTTEGRAGRPTVGDGTNFTKEFPRNSGISADRNSAKNFLGNRNSLDGRIPKGGRAEFHRGFNTRLREEFHNGF